jgi:hypothetical protein
MPLLVHKTAFLEIKMPSLVIKIISKEIIIKSPETKMEFGETLILQLGIPILLKAIKIIFKVLGMLSKETLMVSWVIKT